MVQQLADTTWRQLRQAAELLLQHDRQQIPWDPADDGFVFSRSQVEQFATREIRLNNARIGQAKVARQGRAPKTEPRPEGSVPAPQLS